MKRNTVKIKPCPFCGSSAFVDYDEADHQFTISCVASLDKCIVQPKASCEFDFSAVLVAWNTRIKS